MEELDRQIDLTLPKHLTLDLSGVTFMDSSGIAVLLRALRRVRELTGSVNVIHVPEQAAKVLRAAGVDRLMKFDTNLH
jgi:stage II sporulation protein AA (anti-sigma F factor antagonist)